jgi:Uma2 family endonuclease
MTAPRPTTLMKAEDLLSLPDDASQYELVNGELVVMPASSRRHSLIGQRIAWKLAEFVDQHGLGDVYGADAGFVLHRNPDTVRSPDAAFVERSRVLPLADDPDADLFLELAPDLAVEVISPSNSIPEITAKAAEYIDAGSREVWIVNPRTETVTVRSPRGTAQVLRRGDVIDGGELLPGFRLPVADVFR